MPKEGPPTYSQLIRRLPFKLQSHFMGFGDYVESILEEYEPEGGWQFSELKKDRDWIKLLAFLFMLEDFLMQGTLIAKQAIAVFEDLGENGFMIGPKTEFTRNNENTLRGEKLSNQLVSQIVKNNQLEEFQDEISLKLKIVKIARSVSHNQRMDRSRKDT